MVLDSRLTALPGIEALRRLSQSLAMLDAIMSPEWEDRYYSFNSTWSEGKMMGSMRDGAGDDYFILFNSHGAIIKGFAHESPLSPYSNGSGEPWPGILDAVPTEFQDFLSEPAFSIEDTTFCLWRQYADSSWQSGKVDYPEGDGSDGSEELLSILDENPATYQKFAEEYYEKEVELALIEHIYQHQPLSDEVIRGLNAEVAKEDLTADIEEIGYPDSQG